MNTLNYNITNISRTLEELKAKEEKKEQRKEAKKQLEIEKAIKSQENYKRLCNDLYYDINDFFIKYNNIDLAYYNAIIEKENILKNYNREEQEQAREIFFEILEEIKNDKLIEIEARKQYELLINYNNVKTKQTIKKVITFIFKWLLDGFVVFIIILIGLLGMDTGKKRKWRY